MGWVLQTVLPSSAKADALQLGSPLVLGSLHVCLTLSQGGV
jgi:hypothetical protein